MAEPPAEGECRRKVFHTLIVSTMLHAGRPDFKLKLTRPGFCPALKRLGRSSPSAGERLWR
jgi:hypothetical protein